MRLISSNMNYVCVCLFMSMGLPGLCGDEPAERVLFDGTSVAGWAQVGPGRFVLEDGVLRTEGGMGLLWYTKEKLGNCVIRVEYKTEKADDNSGVFIRIADKPKDEWFAVHNGYEVQIADSGDPFHRTGSIYSLSKADKLPGKVGQWNTLEITLKGDLVFVAVNGEEVNRFDPKGPVPERTKEYEPKRGPRPESGYIGLQNHHQGSNVSFRRVSVRPLANEPDDRRCDIMDPRDVRVAWGCQVCSASWSIGVEGPVRPETGETDSGDGRIEQRGPVRGRCEPLGAD